MVKKTQNSPSSVRLGRDLDADVERLCAEMDMGRSSFIRKAVRHYVARQDHISSILAAARGSYFRYKATGRGIPWEEAEDWLRNWGEDGIKEPRTRDMRRSDSA